MASQKLFNRSVRFRLFRRVSRTSRSLPFLAEFTKNNINATFQKALDVNVRSTGTISVTNLTREEIKLFASPTESYPMLYSFEAGYGDDLHIVSEGYVNRISFRHDGSDLNVDFTVGEGHPYGIDTRAQTLGLKDFPKGTTISAILDHYRQEGVQIKTDGDRDIQADLSNAKIEHDLKIVGVDFQDALVDTLAQYGYTIYVVNQDMVVTRNNPLPKPNLQNLRQLRLKYDPNLIKLNFKTGLLQASLDTDYVTDFVNSINTLSFKTLWIAQLAPLSFLELNEESRYQNLQGIYHVTSTSISLNNFQGPFYISGKAVHIESDFSRKTLKLLRPPESILRRSEEISQNIQNRARSLAESGLRRLIR